MKHIIIILSLLVAPISYAATPFDNLEISYDSIIPGAEPRDSIQSAVNFLKISAEPIEYQEPILAQDSNGRLSLDYGPTITVVRESEANALIDSIIGLIGYDMFGDGVTIDTLSFATTDGYISTQLTDVFNAFVVVIAAQNELKQDYIKTGEIIPYLDSYPQYIDSIVALLEVINTWNAAIGNYNDYIETIENLKY